MEQKSLAKLAIITAIATSAAPIHKLESEIGRLLSWYEIQQIQDPLTVQALKDVQKINFLNSNINRPTCMS